MSNLLPSSPHDVTRLDGTLARIFFTDTATPEIYTFVELMDASKIPELVAMCTGKPVGFIDSLQDESYGALAKACIEVNFNRAMVLAASDPTIAAKVLPLAHRMDLVGRMAAGLLSKLSSPASAASPAGPGTPPSTTPPTSSPPSSEPAPDSMPSAASGT
ncbi:MAG: hypothetical protein IPL39_14430 [Opitutaceae bacterium]|nr:hypothetical protein [Opitutaceae bacterium]